MTRRNTQDLKNALLALQVNKPLKLKAPDLERAQAEVPQVEVPQTRLPKFQAPISDTTPARKDPPERTKNKSPQYEGAHNEATSDQPPQDEHAHNEEARFEEPMESVSGFFKLSHAIFSDPLLREVSGDCFRLFLWLSMRAWRYPSSPGVTRASVRFMEEKTGMSHATVSRALKSLKDGKLIKLVETDFKRGNVWKISSMALTGRGPEDGARRSERPRNESAQLDLEAASKCESSSLNLREEQPQKAHNIKNYKNKRKLSKSGVLLAADPAMESQETLDTILRQQAIEDFEIGLDAPARQNFLERFTQREFPHGFLPPSRVISAMAAWAWYSERNACNETLAHAM